MVGKALGKEAEAQRLVDELTKRFADVAAAHPQFAGVPAIFLQAPYYEGSAIAYQDGLSTDFLTDLGFVIPKELDAFARRGQAYIPVEKLDVLDAGKVLIWATEDAQARAELEEQAVRPARGGEGGPLVFTDGELAGAIYFTSLLSLPFVLDQLVPAAGEGGRGQPGDGPRVLIVQPTPETPDAALLLSVARSPGRSTPLLASRIASRLITETTAISADTAIEVPKRAYSAVAISGARPPPRMGGSCSRSMRRCSGPRG